MPKFISVTNRLGRKMLVNKDHITVIADRSSDNNPEYQAEIDFISGGDDYIYTKESFDEIVSLLEADMVNRKTALSVHPELLNENRDDVEMAAYARGWNAAVENYMDEIKGIDHPELQDMPAGDKAQCGG